MKKESAASVLGPLKEEFEQDRERWTAEQITIIEREFNYFDTNAERTRYRQLRSQGYFIGSGVVEAGCKHVIGQRMKQSGMFWGEKGAETLLGLRCLFLGPHFEAAWQGTVPILAAQRETKRQWCALDS